MIYKARLKPSVPSAEMLAIDIEKIPLEQIEELRKELLKE